MAQVQSKKPKRPPQFKWTPQRLEAAQLAAADELTNQQIADKVGVARQTFDRWKARPEFKAKIEEHWDLWEREFKGRGLAEKENRVAYLNERERLMWEVIQARAEQYADDPEAAPGAHTGLLVKQYKSIGYGKDTEKVVEWVVDTGLLAEMRAHEKQAAQELGQWSERQSITVDLDREIKKLAEELGKSEDEVRAELAAMMGKGM